MIHDLLSNVILRLWFNEFTLHMNVFRKVRQCLSGKRKKEQIYCGSQGKIITVSRCDISNSSLWVMCLVF